MENQDNLSKMRHSAEHVLAQALYRLYPGVKMAMGPAIAEGFYGDFEFPEGVTISAEDLPKIEAEMQKIIKERLPIRGEEISAEKARELFKDNPYKQEWIKEIGERGEKVSVYWTGDAFVDICIGPHVENTGDIKIIKLLSVAGAYWRGDSNNIMLTRIYGTAFENKKDLDEYIRLKEEAEKRDHRKLGSRLELFHIDETAPGAPYWLPKGLKIINTLKDYWRSVHEENGYQEISAPIMNSNVLWQRSGHWDHYKDDMYIIEKEPDEGVQYALKPMNCPNAITVYALKTRSYRDLPIRFSQIDTIHRKEASGALMGLFRVRQFQQDDAHIFLTEDMLEDEFNKICAIVERLYSDFKLQYSFKLSTRPDGFLGEKETWDHVEGVLKKILEDKVGAGNYTIDEGGGAFYGPKVDIDMVDCMGRKWQMGTIQFDYQLATRFDLKYADSDGSLKTPVIIHRALYGSFERFFGIMTEHFAGKFPLWLSPVHATIIPIAEGHQEYANKVFEKLRESGLIRVEKDYSSESMQKRIRNAQMQYTPYMIVIGENEAKNGTVSVRTRENQQMNDIPLDGFMKDLMDKIKTKSLDL